MLHHIKSQSTDQSSEATETALGATSFVGAVEIHEGPALDSGLLMSFSRGSQGNGTGTSLSTLDESFSGPMG